MGAASGADARVASLLEDRARFVLKKHFAVIARDLDSTIGHRMSVGGERRVRLR